MAVTGGVRRTWTAVAGALASTLVAAAAAGCGDDGELSCASGWVVHDGVCVPQDAGPGMDGGPEGGVPDGGPTDGGPSDGAPADAGEPTPERFLRRFLDGVCRKAVGCEFKLGFGAIAQIYCHPQAFDLLRTEPDGQFSFRADRVELDPERAADCLDKLDTSSCDVFEAGLADETCLGAIRGLVEPGAGCWADFECRNGVCEGLDAMCEGSCVAYAGEEDTCGSGDPEGRECGRGLRCREGRCEPLGAADDPCESSGNCGSGLWCNPETMKCEARPEAGDMCDVSFSGDPCTGDLVCTEVTSGDPKQCVAGQELDEACSFDQPCRPGLRCHPDRDVCIDLSGPDGPCDELYNCPAGFQCVDGTCTPQPFLGHECDGEPECLFGSCNSGRCTVLSGGETCTEGDECRSSECTFPSVDGGTADTGTCEPVALEDESCADVACGEGLGCLADTCMACDRFER